MCILMYFGPGAMPIRSHLENAVINNPDGFGYAVLTWGDAGIITGQSMDSDALIEEFLSVRAAYPMDTAIFHARIATQGSVCVDNCHPFIVNHRILRSDSIDGTKRIQGEMVLAHNGMLPCYPGKGDDRSDTKMFAEDILMRRFPHLDSAKTRQRLERYIGGSKVIILTTDPAYKMQAYIFNERLGSWLKHDGAGDIWYSNTSYQKSHYSYSYVSTRPWPATVGSIKPGAVYDYDEDRDWYVDVPVRPESDVPLRLACVGCQYSLVYCRCTGTIKGVYLPEDQVRMPSAAVLFTSMSDDETPDVDPVWTCRGCETVGAVGDDAKCLTCGVMYCCDMTEDECFCWDEASGRLRSKAEQQFARRLRDIKAEISGADQHMKALTAKAHESTKLLDHVIAELS